MGAKRELEIRVIKNNMYADTLKKIIHLDDKVERREKILKRHKELKNAVK